MNKYLLVLGVLGLAGCTGSKPGSAPASAPAAQSKTKNASPYSGTWASLPTGSNRVVFKFKFVENQKFYFDVDLNSKATIKTSPGTYVLKNDYAIATVKLLKLDTDPRKIDSTDTYRLTPLNSSNQIYMELINAKFLGTDGKRHEVKNSKIAVRCMLNRVG